MNYILASMTLLGQACLYLLSMPMEMNYLWSMVAQSGQEDHFAVKNRPDHRLVWGSHLALFMKSHPY